MEVKKSAAFNKRFLSIKWKYVAFAAFNIKISGLLLFSTIFFFFFVSTFHYNKKKIGAVKEKKKE
jgi:hypothetical protein